MKGFVKVDRCDVLSAIIGFGVKSDFAKDARKKVSSLTTIRTMSMVDGFKSSGTKD